MKVASQKRVAQPSYFERTDAAAGTATGKLRLHTETTLSAGSLDSSRVAELYLEYSSELRAFLTGVLRDTDLAAEVLQSTFLKASELGHTAQAETIKGWLFRVAYHEAMQVRRRQEIDQRVTRRVAWDVSRSVEGADGKILRSEAVERVREQLETLPHELRVIVRMKIYEDKTFAEIAKEIGVPMGTVVSRMRTAIQKLGRELTEFSDL
ncbi:MAG: polymerase sigma factor, sigma-70 family [Planctomycetaceae bacterium]|nr:polymerase sigma factor, sigma-70 family [Planctomycetaceae bacterium]